MPLKNWLLGGAALPAFIVGPAMAADLPVKAPAPAAVTRVYDWTGLYVGLNAGGAWGRSALNTSASCTLPPGATFLVFGCSTVPVVDAAGTGSMSKAAFVGGGQIGYNLQSNSAVFGVEVDFNSFHIKNSRQGTGNYAPPFPPTAFTLSSSVNTNWLFTARGRVGWAFNNLLPYVTGGLAVTDLSASNSFQDNCCSGPGPGPASGAWSASKTKVGWTVGGGLEWAFAQNWSAKVEYLYVHFDSIGASGLIIAGGPAYASAISTSTDLTANIARAGINYKF